MKKYSANYSYTNHNFVIQNLQPGKFNNSEIKPLLFVLKNLLQRGCPTLMSQYLQKEIGSIHLKDDFDQTMVLAPTGPSIWHQTIRGGEEGNPARRFFESLPRDLGEYGFVQPLILPEVEINEITNYYNPEFVNQQVDFYLPQARLVIEIDGQQHKNLDTQRISDTIRDAYLGTKRIKTIRISTTQLRNGQQYRNKIQEIVARLQEFNEALEPYRSANSPNFSDSCIQEKMLPTAVIRFQILIIELLLCGRLSLDSDWRFNICNEDPIGDFAKLAIEDTLLWLEKLILLRDKHQIKKPDFSVSVNPRQAYVEQQDCINVCFSILNKYTDEYLTTNRSNSIFVSNDYFDSIEERDYFRTSTADSINYRITDDDIEVLEFFLLNIFGKPNFRVGQFPIVANALNQNDTIGLLPTGGGKSLCYQLPCLLQPSVNFVVCPIKSLMQDQRDNLVSNVLINHVSFLNADIRPEEREQTMNSFGLGRYLLLWISPERFQIKAFREEIKRIVNNLNISYAVIDEVHCLSEWGHDFRTAYLNLAKTIDLLSPKDNNDEGIIKFIGLTATASVNVLNDIKAEFSRQRERLEEENIKSLLDYARPELHFEVIKSTRPKEDILMECVAQDGFINRTRNKSAIVFTPNVTGDKGCYNLSTNFNNRYPHESRWYSGSMPKINKLPIFSSDREFNTYKQQVQTDFKQDQFQVMFATKAFGMGIDKPNVFYTYHYGLPASVESLYQEAGRAGRWDRGIPENNNLIANCYVLYTPELTENQALVDEMLAPQTTFDRCRQINSRLSRETKKDVFSQFFLFQSGKLDIAQEYDRIVKVIITFFVENQTRTISHSEIRGLEIGPDDFEQVIYRLTLLGIAKDWTRDFVTSFEVEFATLDEDCIINSVASYIHKYEHELDVRAAIESVNLPNNLEDIWRKSIWYLLTWINNSIIAQRKQSLKTIRDWCDSFTTSEEFKKRIDSYFTFNETVFVFQHIAEHPLDYKRWFEAFLTRDEQGNYTKDFISIGDCGKRKDALSRFLVSFNKNTGLNFVSGLLRLILDEYEDTDGRIRFESSLQVISKSESLSEEDKETIFNQLIRIAAEKLNDNNKRNLCESLMEFFPRDSVTFIEKLNQHVLYTERIQNLNNQLNNLISEIYANN